MHHAAILNIGACADCDAADIRAQHAIIPDGNIRPDCNITNNPASGCNKGAGVNVRRLTVDGDDRDILILAGHYSLSYYGAHVMFHAKTTKGRGRAKIIGGRVVLIHVCRDAH